MMPGKIIRIGTRKSPLALWQTSFVKAYLLEHFPGLSCEIIPIITRGDKTQEEDKPLPEIGGKGLFTEEFEESLRRNEIDIAVHSLKDLPTELHSDFLIGAIPERGPIGDVLISKDNQSFHELAKSVNVGTSSLRRSSQLKKLRPDIQAISIRGNVDTRIRKVRDLESNYAATILAEAGIVRLGKISEISYVFSFDEMLPAPGQGALAIQCRRGDARILEYLKEFNDPFTSACVSAERKFLSELGAGCNTPVAAFGEVSGSEIKLRGRVLSPDGSVCIEVSGIDQLKNSENLGAKLAKEALTKGAEDLLTKYGKAI